MGLLLLQLELLRGNVLTVRLNQHVVHPLERLLRLILDRSWGLLLNNVLRQLPLRLVPGEGARCNHVLIFKTYACIPIIIALLAAIPLIILFRVVRGT